METITTFNWNAVIGEGVLFAFAVITLLADALLGKPLSKRIFPLALIGLFVALAAESWGVYSEGGAFGDILSQSHSFGIFAVICAILTALMALQYYAKGGGNINEFLSMLMICTAGLMLFVRSRDLMFSFVALETATICLYAMSAWSRKSASSLEAGARYLISGGVSGAIILMGIALIYGAGLPANSDLLNFSNVSFGLDNGLFMSGLMFVVCGLLFKISAFPFQFWSPDVYQGSPTPVSAFFAVASKGAGIAFLLTLCASFDFSKDLAHIHDKLVSTFSVVAACTILVGNLGGITQIRTKRLMAFSGIANAGYLLVLVAAALKVGPSVGLEDVLYFYLLAYMFANYGVFFVVNRFGEIDDAEQSLADYRGLKLRSPIALGTLIVNLASLSGIPPTAGFFGKLLILIAAWAAGLYWLVGVMIIGSVMSIYYYFGWMRAALEPAEGEERQLIETPSMSATMVALSVATVVFSAVVYAII